MSSLVVYDYCFNMSNLVVYDNCFNMSKLVVYDNLRSIFYIFRNMDAPVDYEVPKFQVWDYVVFASLLALSAAIGVFHAVCGGRQSTTKEFLLADKQMNVAPVAMSMLASFMSAITLMGNPAEIYNYGTQFIMIGLSYSIVIPAAAHLYIPIFYNLNVTSAYEVTYTAL